VDGTGLRHLQGLKLLENLNCHSAPISDAGLEWIGKLASLVRLEIVHTRFTDVGAAHLKGLVKLERLQLGSRGATGASLAALAALPRLRELDVHDGLTTLDLQWKTFRPSLRAPFGGVANVGRSIRTRPHCPNLGCGAMSRDKRSRRFKRKRRPPNVLGASGVDGLSTSWTRPRASE
jgi:hypothetical protein